jgi:zinc protease
MKTFYIALLILLQTAVLSAQVDRSKEPDPDAPKEINLGDLKSIELENGLKVFLVPKPGYGKFAFSLSINQPDIAKDPQPELRDILSKLYYKKASVRYSQKQIDSIIDFHGAKMGATINGGYIIGLKEDTRQLMGVYTDCLIHPNINQSTLDELIVQRIKQEKAPKKQQTLSNNGTSFGITLLDSLLHEKKIEKEKQTVSRESNYSDISLSELQEFQRQRIVSNNSTAILIGDFTENSAREVLERYFASWKKGTPLEEERASTADTKTIAQREIYVIDNPLAVQSKVGFHWNLGDAFQYFDHHIPMEVMNQILGGYANAYIYQNLREDKGLCYFALSSISCTGSGGSGFINTSVRTEKTAIAVENIIYEMLRIRNQKVSDNTIRMAKNSLIGKYARSLGGVALQRFLSFAMTQDDYNLPDDYLKTYPQKVGEVTKADVIEMAQKYVKPNNCVIIIEGNAKALKGTLEAYGLVKYFTKEGKTLEF